MYCWSWYNQKLYSYNKKKRTWARSFILQYLMFHVKKCARFFVLCYKMFLLPKMCSFRIYTIWNMCLCVIISWHVCLVICKFLWNKIYVWSKSSDDNCENHQNHVIFFMITVNLVCATTTNMNQQTGMVERKANVLFCHFDKENNQKREKKSTASLLIHFINVRVFSNILCSVTC